MSIASGFRHKWGTLMRAFDATRDSADDHRFAAASKAASDADLMLLEKAAYGALTDTITRLRSDLAQAREALEALLKAAVGLAGRHEASMAVWRDKLSTEMLIGMRGDLDATLAAGKKARAALSSPGTEKEDLVHSNAQDSGAVNVPVCQWQPIETAPMDGTQLIGLIDGRATTISARVYGLGCGTATERRWSETDGNDVYPCRPSHWMPLPAQPK